MELKNEGFCNNLIHASWVHLHWASSPIIIENDSNMLPNTMYDTIVQLGGTIIASIYD